MASRVLTVMFTDIKGFTERTSRSSREELDSMLEEHEQLLQPILPAFEGRLVKTVGDAFLVVFDSPTNAVLCGVAIQERLHERNQGRPQDELLEVRVAINAGEIIEREGDVFGEAVNIASRIEGITDANEIYFTESVYLNMTKAEVPSSEVGMRRLKGIPEPIKIYKVIRDREADKYRKLVDKLRTRRFADVPIPTTGEAPSPSPSPYLASLSEDEKAKHDRVALALGSLLLVAAVVVVLVVLQPWKTTATLPDHPAARPGEARPSGAGPAEADPLKPALAGVDKALEEKDLGLALARAEKLLKEHRDRKEAHAMLERVVAREVEVLTEEARFADALALIDKRRKGQEYVTFAAVEKAVLLQAGAHWTEKGHMGRAGSAYGTAYQRYGSDPAVLRAVIRDMNRTTNTGLRRLAESAALKLAAMTEGALEEPSRQALLNALYSNDPARNQARTVRKVLAERAPGVADDMRERLASSHRHTRINALRFLQETGAITPAEELSVHVTNLFLLRATGGSDQPLLEESIAYVEGASAGADWSERKKKVSFHGRKPPQAFRTRTALARRVMALFGKAFLPEAEKALLTWTRGGDLVARHAAFHVLVDAGREEALDVWAYQESNLLLTDYRYEYTVLAEAVAFFKGMAGSDKAAAAKALLEKALAAMKEHQDTWTIYKSAGPRRIIEGHIKAVEEALAAFK